MQTFGKQEEPISVQHVTRNYSLGGANKLEQLLMALQDIGWYAYMQVHKAQTQREDILSLSNPLLSGQAHIKALLSLVRSDVQSASWLANLTTHLKEAASKIAPGDFHLITHLELLVNMIDEVRRIPAADYAKREPEYAKLAAECAQIYWVLEEVRSAILKEAENAKDQVLKTFA